MGAAEVIDDFAAPFPRAATRTDWAMVSDRVMGGVSSGRLDPLEGERRGMRLRGEVSLENNGGFVQAALDLAPGDRSVDAAGWAGIALVVRGNGERYNLHLRTEDIRRPWESYRASFVAGADWAEVRLPFAGVEPHRTAAPFDPARLRRIGLVAIGREFGADLSVADLRFYA
ncbi:CIA30 family protein [Histidinibacterium lentulum]|uniref:CIA30 family protein n=1 Tax=Histidinibacterium lentulum TaxID=2480588 RepID=A0A3N2QLC4_9RHOB|nr:CIA30 family protein [Histidinibacterium lentulum]ROT95865.1 CIA30 family protein [Histidinibacterium lentulum]